MVKSLTERLKDLQKKRGVIDATIAVLEREQRFADGKVVKTVEEIACETHGAGHAVTGEPIRDSGFVAHIYRFEKDHLDTYLCDECDRTLGYDCPSCGGIVKGEVVRRRYDDLRSHSGNAGTRYSCRECGTQLGDWVIMHS